MSGYGWTGLKRIKVGGEEWIWVDRNKENKEGGERSGYGVNRNKKKKGGGRGVDMGAQD